MKNPVKVGDYVLATKYTDGDPCDHFCVGYVDRMLIQYNPSRYHVVDGQGQPFRGNGFRRAEQISEKEGIKLLAIFPDIANVPGRSLWGHLSKIRQEIAVETALRYSQGNKNKPQFSPLPNDWGRCHDYTCDLAVKCRRWLERFDCGPETAHYATLKDLSDPCQAWVSDEPLSEEVDG
jgi:hypothetical protein